MLIDIFNDFESELERYRSSTSLTQQYLSVYESECNILIGEISECPSFDDAQGCFDALHAIQRRLSIAIHRFDFPLNDKLRELAYNLDRDDVYSRVYWYGEFRKGVKWPDG